MVAQAGFEPGKGNSMIPKSSDNNGENAVPVVISMPLDIYLGGFKTASGVATNRYQIQLFNPLISGINLKIAKAMVKGNSGTITAFGNTTALTNLIPVADSIMNLNISGPASGAEMYWDDLVAGTVPDIVSESAAGFALSNSGTNIDTLIGTTVPPGHGIVLENSENTGTFLASFQFLQESVG